MTAQRLQLADWNHLFRLGSVPEEVSGLVTPDDDRKQPSLVVGSGSSRNEDSPSPTVKRIFL